MAESQWSSHFGAFFAVACCGHFVHLGTIVNLWAKDRCELDRFGG